MDTSEYIAQIQQAASDSGFTPVLGNIIVAQGQVESDNFTSNLFQQCNNAFGYKYVGQANATQGIPAPSSEGGYYADYANVYYSALEVCNWIIRNVDNYNSIQTPSDYAYALKNSNIGAYYGGSENSYALDIAYYFQAPSVAVFVNKNPTTSFVGVAVVLIGMSAYIYYLIKKYKKNG